MKEKRVSIFSRARYHLHNLLVRGTFARVIAFTIVTVIIGIILALVLSLVPSQDGDMLISIWNTTLCALDGGTIAGMEANDGQKVVLLIITLFGIVFSSVLVGIVTTGIEEQLDKIAHEGSKVLERRPHVLVLGCIPVTVEILGSLARDNEDGQDVEPIVVLEEERDIVEVGKELDFKLEGFTKTKAIYRQGCPYSEDDLNLCSIENAHSILVTARNDDEAVKTVLVCTNLMQKLGHVVPLFVVCENEDAFAVVQKEVGESLHLINPDRVLEHTFKTMQSENPSMHTIIAGDEVEVPDQANRLLIEADDTVEQEESDARAIRALLELNPLCEKRRAQNNPLEIVCALYYEKNVTPAKYAGADETILVGRLLVDKITGLIEDA